MHLIYPVSLQKKCPTVHLNTTETKEKGITVAWFRLTFPNNLNDFIA